MIPDSQLISVGCFVSELVRRIMAMALIAAMPPAAVVLQIPWMQ